MDIIVRIKEATKSNVQDNTMVTDHDATQVLSEKEKDLISGIHDLLSYSRKECRRT